MTIETADIDGAPVTKSGPYDGNGSITTFDYEFRIQSDDELLVTRQNANLTETVLDLDTDYTVTGVGDTTGGTIVLVDADRAPTNTKLVIQYDGDFNQSTDYSNQGSIQLEVLENTLDHLMMHVRALKELSDRSVKVDAFDTYDSAVLEDAYVNALAAATSAAEAAASAATAVSYGAVGDGTTNDTDAFDDMDTNQAGERVNLGGQTYLVDALPTGAEYVNGFFLVNGETLDAATSRALISSSGSTGSIEDVAGSTVSHTNVASSGRSTKVQNGVFLTRNGLAEGVRTVLISSFDAKVSCNIGAAVAVRDTSVTHNTSASVATEDSFSQAKKAGQFASLRAEATGESYTFAGAARDVTLQGLHSAAVAVVNYHTGGGYGARFTPTVVNGTITEIAVTGGTDYADTETLVFEDILGSGSGAAATMTSSAGVPQSITLTDGGSDYSDDGVKISVAGIGSYQFGAATSGHAYNNGDATAMIGGRQGIIEAGALRSAMVGFDGSEMGANAEYSIMMGGEACYLDAAGSAQIGGTGVRNIHAQCVTLGGRYYETDRARTIVTGSGSSPGTTADRTFEIDCDNGNVVSAGTLSGSATFADYAEMFENETPGVIPLGTIVTLVGETVAPAKKGDYILGVVSATPIMVADDSMFTWGQRYLTGEFGETLYEEILDPNWKPLVEDRGWPTEIENPAHPQYDLVKVTAADGTVSYENMIVTDPRIPNPEPAPLVPNPTPQETIRVKVENPDYDPSRPNVARSDRPEDWSCIGLLGKLHVRVGPDVKPGMYVEADGAPSPGNKPTKLFAMRVIAPYDVTRGYAIVKCVGA
jgi:hypothetical protein